MSAFYKVSILALALAAGFPASAQTDAAPAGNGLYIKITDANVKKSLMALPPFQFTGSPNSSKNAVKIGKDIYDVFKNDMEVSNFFEFIKPDAYAGELAKGALRPADQEPGGFTYPAWAALQTEFLVKVGYRVLGDSVSMDAYVYYVPQAKLVLSKTYKASTSDARSLAHTFANDLVKELTGTRGSFLSKIVTSRSTKPSEKEIFVMDYDAANAKQISSHDSIATSPTWSYDGKKIAYSAFAYHPKEKTRNMDLFTYELATGRRYLVSYRRGINSGASYTPDGKSLLLTISNGGSPDIYKMTLDGLGLTRITTGKTGEMNVEPSMSPDGSRIAFSTTRSGQPMLYVMSSDGANAKRLTFAGQYNSTPAWSPDSKRIVFAGFDKSHFDIFIMDADGTNMSRLTSAKKPNGKDADNEDPTFSPDGRTILFRSNRTGKYQLYLVSTDGENERRTTFDNYDYFKPRWSPSFE